MSLLYNIKTGEEWQELCDKALHLKFNNEGYQKVADTSNGDCGIEGFTRTGKVFQCYFPEGNYDTKTLTEKTQDKINKDLRKLTTYQKDLSSILGDIKIKEWILLTSEIRDKKLLPYCNKKKDTIKKAKDKPTFIDDKFDILIYDQDYFSIEFASLAATGNVKIDLYKTTANLKYDDINSELVDNLKRKLYAVFSDSKDADDTIQEYLESYSKGIAQRNKLQISNPTYYDELNNTFNSQEKEIKLKCRKDSTNNNELFYQILDDFETKLRTRLSGTFTEETIDDLKHFMVSDWLMRCPMNFVKRGENSVR